jgi:hypothetical protein
MVWEIGGEGWRMPIASRICRGLTVPLRSRTSPFATATAATPALTGFDSLVEIEPFVVPAFDSRDYFECFEWP